MFIRKIALIIICILLTFSSALATTDVPDPCMSIATMDGVTTETVSLFSVPNGTGVDLDEAQIFNDGTIIDATITLVVMNGYGVPIADFPAEDMWLDSSDDGLAPCVVGTMADFDTDTNGQTSWTSPLHAGGHSMSSCIVLINGQPLCQGPFAMYFNSADVNGDGIVNLSDLGPVAEAFYGSYDYSVDFFPDGVLNLSDIGRFAAAMGASCQ